MSERKLLCKGCMKLGTGCGRCERCLEQIAAPVDRVEAAQKRLMAAMVEVHARGSDKCDGCALVRTKPFLDALEELVEAKVERLTWTR